MLTCIRWLSGKPFANSWPEERRLLPATLHLSWREARLSQPDPLFLFRGALLLSRLGPARSAAAHLGGGDDRRALYPHRQVDFELARHTLASRTRLQPGDLAFWRARRGRTIFLARLPAHFARPA